MSKKKNYVKEPEAECKEFIKAFGEKVRRLRKKKNWTLEDCEDHGYPSWKHLRDVEGGEKNITITTVCRVANLFNIQPFELLKDLRLEKFGNN